MLGGALSLSATLAGLGAAGCASSSKPMRGGVPMSNLRLFCFTGGRTGTWAVVSARAIKGDPLPPVDRVEIVQGLVADPPEGGWVLRGVTSNDRYVTRPEKQALVQKQAGLGRPTSTLAALIPIRKDARWWALTQDERRAILEDKSKHIEIGMKYLPGVARRLHHCRDLGEVEPFDFLTLFDYAPADAGAFDELVAALRATEEWKYVDREVDLRLVRVS
jgi:hypothetical protein